MFPNFIRRIPGLNRLLPREQPQIEPVIQIAPNFQPVIDQALADLHFDFNIPHVQIAPSTVDLSRGVLNDTTNTIRQSTHALVNESLRQVPSLTEFVRANPPDYFQPYYFQPYRNSLEEYIRSSPLSRKIIELCQETNYTAPLFRRDYPFNDGHQRYGRFFVREDGVCFDSFNPPNEDIPETEEQMQELIAKYQPTHQLSTNP